MVLKTEQDGAVGRGRRTKNAIVRATIALIAKKGIEGTSVLEITESLGISNGNFYYHFQNMAQLLGEVGHVIVRNLNDQIESGHRADPAAQVARGALVTLRYVDLHPEMHAIVLRVVDDPERLHTDLSDRLRDDVRRGQEIGRFPIADVDYAAQFCRAVLATSLRQKKADPTIERLAELTAIHTLGGLGVPLWEAHDIVEREKGLVAIQDPLESESSAIPPSEGMPN